MNLFKYSLNWTVVFVALILLTVYPYIFGMMLGLPDEKILNVIFCGLALFLLLRTQGRQFLPSTVLFVILVQSLTWFAFALYHDDSSYYTRIFFLVMTAIVILLLLRSHSLYKFTYFYNGILLAQCLLGGIAFVLIFAGLLQPLMIFENGGRLISFYGLTTSNAVYGNFIRVGGFFDEPGALAMWGIFALVINKLIFNNRKIEILLMISLIFTFSAAYFILLAFYILFFFFRGGKRRNILSLVIITPLLIGVFYLLRDNEEFKWLTTERFQGGEIRSKRNEYTENAKIVFYNNYYMGAGGQNLEKTIFEQVNDNPYEILAKDGLIGYIITYLPLLVLCYVCRRNKDVILGSLLLFICYQQRPFHINMMHYFMLYLYMTVVCYNDCKGGAENIILDKLRKTN